MNQEKERTFRQTKTHSRDGEKMKKTEKSENVLSMREELTIVKEEIKRLSNLEDRLCGYERQIPYTNSALKQKIQKQIRETHQYKEEQERVAFLLEKSLKVIMAAIPQLSGIEKQVFYLQRYSGKSLVEISKDLGYDYGYIRRLASQAKKKAEKVSQAQSL